MIALLFSLAVAAPPQDELLWGDAIDLALDEPHGVVGGDPVPPGGWPDAAAVVFYDSYVGCTGTLIAPNAVLTAAHCAGGITDVIIGTRNWTTNQGEEIGVKRTIVHPSYSSGGYDIAVLLLHRNASAEPRIIGTDCVADVALQDDAEVAVVGFGMVNTAGTQSTTRLHDGRTTIDSHDCSRSYADGVWMGCQPSINPGGELGAGGDGVDACFGDSGGPLYLMTERGAYLVGVTSRAYGGVNPNYPCRDGGIFVRPDAVVPWLEQKIGSKLPRPECNLAPEAEADPITVRAGASATTQVRVSDPDGSSFTIAPVRAPAHGTVEGGGSGALTYVADADYAGSDSFVVKVTDDGSPWPASPARSVQVTIDVVVEAAGGSGPGPGPGPDVDDGGAATPVAGPEFAALGCSTTASAGSCWAWALGFGLLWRRRRR